MTKNNVYRGIGRAFLLVLSIAALGFTPAAASAQNEGWTLDPSARAEFGVVSAQTSTRDEQIVVDGDALTFRGQLAFDLEDEDTRFRLEADRIEVVRLGEWRSDSNRDRITAQFDQELDDDWEIQLRARYYDDLVTAESSDTDELQGAVMVTYEPVRAHRVRAQFTWREREYDNGTGGVQTTGDGPRVDLDYRHRLGRYHYVTLDARAESINSDDPQRGYDRWSARLSYTHPLSRDLRVRPGVEYLETRFDGRLTETGSRRHDKLFVPELELLWWPDRWRIEAEAKYISSSSNLVTREREGYRFTLSVGYVL